MVAVAARNSSPAPRAKVPAADDEGKNAAGKREFHFSHDEEPHVLRRAEILKKYPEIKTLFGYEWRTKYIVAGTLALQVFMAWLTIEWTWGPFLAAVYVVGATATHSLFLAIHELAHNGGASTPARNKMIGILANLAIGIPYCITFKAFHMDHHRYQGQYPVDTDIPSRVETYLVTESAFGYVDHTIRKFIFMSCQIFAYAFRPMSLQPQRVAKDAWVAACWVAVFSFDAMLIWWLGPNVLCYTLGSLFLAGSIHPTAGHFLAEHYVMEGNAETYSYYGPLNRLTYNVGYHNEHHDFPSVAWSNLPKVRAMAPEYYDNLPQCKSWVGVIFRYIFDDSISPFSRVKRQAKAE